MWMSSITVGDWRGIHFTRLPLEFWPNCQQCSHLKKTDHYFPLSQHHVIYLGYQCNAYLIRSFRDPYFLLHILFTIMFFNKVRTGWLNFWWRKRTNPKKQFPIGRRDPQMGALYFCSHSIGDNLVTKPHLDKESMCT